MDFFFQKVHVFRLNNFFLNLVFEKLISACFCHVLLMECLEKILLDKICAVSDVFPSENISKLESFDDSCKLSNC